MSVLAFFISTYGQQLWASSEVDYNRARYLNLSNIGYLVNDKGRQNNTWCRVRASTYGWILWSSSELSTYNARLLPNRGEGLVQQKDARGFNGSNRVCGLSTYGGNLWTSLEYSRTLTRILCTDNGRVYFDNSDFSTAYYSRVRD